VTRTRLKVAEGAPGFSLLEAEFVNHPYKPHFHDELVLAVTEAGTATHPFRFPSPPYRTGFDDALNYLIQNQAENCDLQSLSIHLGLSRFQLVRLFNRQVGIPPHAFLVQLRLARACQLLRAGTSITAAAADSGFFDQSALTRHFRRSLGVTLRQYREAARGQAAK
jgi:AraC-like DNA-binding protein